MTTSRRPKAPAPEIVRTPTPWTRRSPTRKHYYVCSEARNELLRAGAHDRRFAVLNTATPVPNVLSTKPATTTGTAPLATNHPLPVPGPSHSAFDEHPVAEPEAAASNEPAAADVGDFMESERVREIVRETLAESAAHEAEGPLSAERVREIVRETMTDRTLLADMCQNLVRPTEFRDAMSAHRDSLLPFF